MITGIKGKLAAVGEDRIVVETDGHISYEMLVPKFMIRRLLSGIGEPMEFYTYHYLEGGAGGSNMIPRLVGFSSVEEREFFEKFITVPDIGVRKALRCFVISTAEIAGAIENNDIKILSSLPGIGRRSSQKIIAALGGKVAKFALIRDEEEAGEPATVSSSIKDEVTDVLLQLGYNPREAENMIEKALKADPDISTAEKLLAAVYRQRTETNEK